MHRVGWIAALLALSVGMVAAGGSAQASRSCGKVSVFGSNETVVAVRGVSCSKARSVARGFGREDLPRGWRCGQAHAPFDRANGIEVHASCGKGGSGDLRKRPHSLLIGSR